MQMQERAYNAEDVVRFLRMLLRKIPGKSLIIWDGSPIHRADVVKQFLSSSMGQRVHLEQLPGSAPELNRAVNWSGTCSNAVNSRISVAKISLR